MQILIKQTNLKLSSEDKEIILEKISQLDKYYPKIIRARVEVEKLTGQKSGDVYRAELNMQLPQRLLRIEKSTPDWRKSIEKVKDHAKLSLSREKKKLIDKHRRKE